MKIGNTRRISTKNLDAIGSASQAWIKNDGSLEKLITVKPLEWKFWAMKITNA